MSDYTRTAKDIVDLIGIDAADRFFKTFGGMTLLIPKGPNNNRAGAARFESFVETVGEEAAFALVRRYGGDNLYIPNGKIVRYSARMRERNRQIVRDYDAGAGIRELVQRYQLCERRITSILKTTITTGEAD